MNLTFWHGKRVFITGHTGFKGSWLSLWLQRLGSEITGYALSPPTTPSLFAVARVADDMRSIIADIRDAEGLAVSLREASPDIVIHMAAQSLVRYSYLAPVETYATNIMGTVHLLDAVRQSDSVRAVVNVTSDKCYQNMEWPWGYRENDSLGGYDPYSSIKGRAELITAAYRKSYFNPSKRIEHGVAVASGRAGNVVGGGDWARDRLVPDVLRAFEAGEPVQIRNPHAIRPWQHVLEPLSGYLALAEKLYIEGHAYAESWNFGPVDADVRPVQCIVEQLTAEWGEGAMWQLDKNPQPHEAHYLKLDSSKAQAKLGWRPRWDLSETLGCTVAWYKVFLKGSDMKTLTLRQIAEYETSRN